MKIGIIKEGKVPVDHRVPFTPKQCKEIKETYPGVELVVQPSDIRCYSNEEYEKEGIVLQEDVSDCDVLFGVKEVNKEDLISNKQYFFFSHTIKKQPYNKTLLQEILKKNITLTDYECLTNSKGFRVVAFGRFAGIVGAYNALWAYGKKHELFSLKRAFECKDMQELFAELNKIDTKGLKVVLTGGGRVSKGAMEVLDEAGFDKVEESGFDSYSENCYLQLDSYEYNEHKDGKAFSFEDFYANGDDYIGTFHRVLSKAPIFIAGAYWDPKAPVLFSKEEVAHPEFKFDVISDITCDINGSVPTTIRSTTIADPVYDLDKNTFEEKTSFDNLETLTIVAVDNLPCELPRDASESFGDQLSKNVIPTLLGKSESDIVSGATIAEEGQLTEKYSYLEDYVA